VFKQNAANVFHRPDKHPAVCAFVHMFGDCSPFAVDKLAGRKFEQINV
jgi:hypothetical protein